MTAKEYLGQIGLLDARIKNLLQEKEVIRNSLIPGGAAYREQVQNSPDFDPYGTWICRMEAKEEEINRDVDLLVDLRLEVTRRINGLQDERHVQILYLRYIKLKRLRDIAEEMDYSYQYVRSMHSEALRRFEERYNKILQTSYKILQTSYTGM